jgi:hypothetical protein
MPDGKRRKAEKALHLFMLVIFCSAQSRLISFQSFRPTGTLLFSQVFFRPALLQPN